MTPQDIPYLKEQIEGKTPTEAMAWFLKEFGTKIALSNSMGAEGSGFNRYDLQNRQIC